MAPNPREDLLSESSGYVSPHRHQTSLISVEELFFCTEAMPLSLAASVEYISLEPMSWPFPALSEKYGWPEEESFFS